MLIPFSRSVMVGHELEYVRTAMESQRLSPDGPFCKKCETWIGTRIGAPDVLLTTSGSSALEMAVLLANVTQGDEVIMPAFTFVSCANAVVLRGGVPVFVDVHHDTLNIDPDEVRAALTPRTKAIIAVHYAGIICDMEAIMDTAAPRGLAVIEDAAHAFLSTQRGRYAGAIGHLGVFSFNYQKNIVAGEGGALVVNDQRYAPRAKIIRHKGTNRDAFLRNETAYYEWVDVGSSFAPSEITAAILLGQIECADEINQYRRMLWDRYHECFEDLEKAEVVERPTVPSGAVHNGHLYYLLLRTPRERDRFIEQMKVQGIVTPFHFVPLDSSPAGRRFGRPKGPLPVTHSAAERLVRLPLWYGMKEQQGQIIDAVRRCVS